MSWLIMPVVFLLVLSIWKPWNDFGIKLNLTLKLYALEDAELTGRLCCGVIMCFLGCVNVRKVVSLILYGYFWRVLMTGFPFRNDDTSFLYFV